MKLGLTEAILWNCKMVKSRVLGTAGRVVNSETSIPEYLSQCELGVLAVVHICTPIILSDPSPPPCPTI